MIPNAYHVFSKQQTTSPNSSPTTLSQDKKLRY